MTELYHSTIEILNTYMSILALLMIARKRNQLECPSTDEYIMKTWYRYTMEFWLAPKKSQDMKFAEKQMEVFNIILREVSQC